MAKKIIRIAPSLLAADFANLNFEISRVIKAKADWIHLDVMDGCFVDNISFGLPVVEAISQYPIFKDVHLMIANPLNFIERFADAGADLITFHIETAKYKKDVKNLIDYIHEFDRAAGISINPETDINKVLPFLKDIDVILIMSVTPGHGGQKFNEQVLEKIVLVKEYIDSHHLDCLIEVDGGINEQTAKKVLDAGADILVSGSYLFSGDMKENIKKLRKS